MVVAAADAKLANLRRDPRCLLLVFEADRPFQGITVRATASIVPDEGARHRLAIASRRDEATARVVLGKCRRAAEFAEAIGGA